MSTTTKTAVLVILLNQPEANTMDKTDHTSNTNMLRRRLLQGLGGAGCSGRF